jgi:hypothetical protein
MPLFGKARNSDAHRYYLLPGQGRGARKKYFQQLLAAIVVGVVFSALLGAALWFLNRR